jgi:hypothetical protein
MKNWVLCYTYGTGAVTLKWNMGILLTKVTFGVCDPKELRATTSYDNMGILLTKVTLCQAKNAKDST